MTDAERWLKHLDGNDTPLEPATHRMRRDRKRGASLCVTGDGRMAMELNYRRPQGSCPCSFRMPPPKAPPVLAEIVFRPHRPKEEA